MAEYDLIFDGKPVRFRICYVRAWDDPQWREQNGLPPRRKFMGRNAKKDRAAFRAASPSKKVGSVGGSRHGVES